MKNYSLNLKTLYTFYILCALLVLMPVANGIRAEENGVKYIDVNQIQSWSATSDSELLIKTSQQTFRATFSQPCVGLSKAATIAFITRENHRLNVHSAVRLPDGSRCNFKDFTRA